LVVKELEWNSPYKVFRKLSSFGYPVRLFLDSANVNESTGRYSFICIGEVEKFHAKDFEGDLFLAFEEFFNLCKGKYNVELDIPFGVYGFISYDANKYIESIQSFQKDDFNFPDMYFFVPEITLVFDNIKRKVWQISLSHERLNLSKERVFDSEFESGILGFNITKDYFISCVNRIKDYIASGDTFQVNFSQRIDISFKGDFLALYDRLRSINPSPFSFFMDVDGFKAISCSPERLVRRQGKLVETRPIAGTRKRGKDKEEDIRFEKELFLSEKERAEHIMLVDLERNDLGKVCRYGTVEVNELMVKELYSHVMHIVSNIRGELMDGKSSIDLIKAMFPGGTITGTPKVRTMEIIAELEPTRRGLYTGSVGYIGFNDTLDLNIVIRTLFFRENRGYIQVGAGIVWDSEPEREYQETLEKAKALLVASGLE